MRMDLVLINYGKFLKLGVFMGEHLKKRNRIKKNIFGIFILVLCLCFGTTTYALERRKVKVAFFPMDGYHVLNDDGSYGGMDVEYLNVLSGYAGWEIEYVRCDSWEDALQKLLDKEVDLVGSAQYSESRAKIYDYADLSSGYTFGVIATNTDSTIAYEDFHKLADVTFGMVKGYVRENEFFEYLHHNGIEYPNVVYYETTAKLQAALDAKEIDALVHTFTEVKDGQRLIGRFAPRPFYYITYKNNGELLRELNQAIVNLKMNRPELENELMNQFYYNRFDKEVILSTEEKNYVEEKGKLVIGYLDHYYPFFYKMDGQIKGLTREMIESGLGITGLKLEYREYANRQEATQALEKGEIDVFAYSIDQEYVLRQKGLKSICEYADVPLVLLVEKNTSLDDIKRISMVNFLPDEMTESIGVSRVGVLKVNDQQSAVDALLDGDVDAALCNGYFAEYLLRTDVKYGNLQIKSVVGEEYTLSLAVREEEAILSGILEKTISKIDPKMINEYMLRENTYPLVSIVDFIRSHSLEIITLLFFIMSGIVLIITRMLADSRKIQKLMYKDTKMDVWNLNYFTYWGEQKLALDKKSHYAIVHLNISKFRRYNIVYGWNAGERLLETFVNTLRTKVDEKTELFARNRGDRFVLLLRYKTEEDFFRRIKELKAEIEKQIQKRTGDHIQLQVGVYMIPAKEVDLRQGVDYSSQALDFVDSDVGNNIKIYDDSIEEMLRERHDRENLLESVDLQKDFLAYYQPKVDIRDGSIVGAEALVRFKDPSDGGKIKSPYFFVPYYEQTGKIIELDYFVFETVCKFLRRRLDENLPVVTISCNFSRMHFTKAGFAGRFEAILDKYQLEKDLIEVEVTETLIMEEINHEIVKENFLELREKGIHLAIDDFGSGYSSLGIFEQIPASVVKMDRSFFLNKENPERQVKVMKGIVTLSEDLDTQVVCEGVETSKDVKLMETIGAFIAQGYYYSRPIPEEEFEKKLNIGFVRE